MGENTSEQEEVPPPGAAQDSPAPSPPATERAAWERPAVFLNHLFLFVHLSAHSQQCDFVKRRRKPTFHLWVSALASSEDHACSSCFLRPALLRLSPLRLGCRSFSRGQRDWGGTAPASRCHRKRPVPVPLLREAWLRPSDSGYSGRVSLKEKTFNDPKAGS